MEQAPSLLTPAEFGREIRRSRATVYRLIEAGLVAVIHLPVAQPDPDKPSAGAVRIPRSEVARLAGSAQTKAS